MDFGNVACKVCGEICASPYTHQSHVVRAHGGKSTVCHLCSGQFRSVTALRPHLNIHLRNRVTQRKFCELCGDFMTSFQALKSHYRAHHPYFMDTYKTVSCPLCLELCTFQEFELHAVKHRAEGLMHPVSTVAHCHICMKKYVSPVAVAAHCWTVHGVEVKLQPALESGVVFCVFCDEAFFADAELREHWFTHLPERLNPLKCDLCPLSFNKFVTLKRHVEAVHPAQYSAKPWCYCADCGMAFFERDLLDVHRSSKECDPLTEGSIRALMKSNSVTTPFKEVITLDSKSDLKFSDADEIALNAITAIEEILSDETIVLSDTSSTFADLERVLNSDSESGDICPGSQSGGELENSITKELESFPSLEMEAELSPSGMIVLDEWNLEDDEGVNPSNDTVDQADESFVGVGAGPEVEAGTTLPDLSLVLRSADEEYKVPPSELFPEHRVEFVPEDLNIPSILDAFSLSTEEFISAPDDSISVDCLVPFPDSVDVSESIGENPTEGNSLKRQVEDQGSTSEPVPKRRKPRRGREFVRCLKCPATFSAYKELIEHSWAHYFPPGPSKCTHSGCSYLAKSTVALYQHSVDCHVTVLPEDFTYQKCKYCFDEFLSLATFEHHADLHKGLDYTSVGSDPLKKTLQNKSQSYRCKVCLQGYTLKASYLKHIRFCKDAYNRCEECNKAFPTATILRAHSRRCAGKVVIPEVSPIYICYCGSTFKTERRFHQHSDKVHLTFKCGQCGKSFPTQKLLKVHLRVHIDQM